MIIKLGPVSLQINLSKNLKNKYFLYNKFIKKNLYKTKFKTLLNVGGGNFKHPKWKILDFYSVTNNKNNRIDILYDLNSKLRIPLDDNSVSIIYTSHTIEHIFKDKFDFIFSEFYRLLDKETGTIRIVYPNIDICYDAYQRNDIDFFYLSPEYKSIEEKFVKIFSMNLLDAKSGDSLSNLEIKKILKDNNKYEALKILEDINNKKTNYFRPDYHRSFWNHDILNNYLSKAGFKKVIKSYYGQSIIPILRNTNYFDNTHPKYSGYTEARIKA